MQTHTHKDQKNTKIDELMFVRHDIFNEGVVVALWIEVD